MKFTCCLIAFLFVFFLESKAQNLFNKDCLGAEQICDQEGIFTFQLLSGQGSILNELSPFFSCLSSGERNNLWIKFTIDQPGLLGFKIIPTSDSHDFDFALYNLTFSPCSDISANSSLEVACNVSGSTFPSPITGLSSSLVDNNGNYLPQSGPMLAVGSGEVFYLLINNFTSLDLETTFSIDFSESTCTFAGCSSVEGKVFLNTNFDCGYSSSDLLVQENYVSLINTATNHTNYGFTDQDGNFTIVYGNLPGNYELQFNTDIETVTLCALTPSNIENTGISLNTENAEISLYSNDFCTYLKVIHETELLIKCGTNFRSVRLENFGTLPANNVVLTLEYPSGVTPLSVNYPFTFVNNFLNVQIPQILPFSNTEVIINDSLSCSFTINDEICVYATTNIPNTCNSINDDDEFIFKYDCSNNKLKLYNLGNEELTEGFRMYLYGGNGLINNLINGILAIGDSLIYEDIVSFPDEIEITLTKNNIYQNVFFEGKVKCLIGGIELVRNFLRMPNRSYTNNCKLIKTGVGFKEIKSIPTNYFYPIPTEGILFSKMNIKEKNAIKVIDLQGRRVDALKYNSTTNSYHFSAELNNGFYIIQSETGEVPPQRIILRR